MPESDWVRPCRHWRKKSAAFVQMMQSVDACTRKLKLTTVNITTQCEITCLNPNVVKKLILIYERIETKLCLEKKHTTRHKPKIIVPKFKPQTEFN